MTEKRPPQLTSKGPIGPRTERRHSRPDGQPSLATPGPTPQHDLAAPGGGTGFLVVGVGASAGGLEAFTQLLGHLPPDTGMAFVLVQHLDPEHESALVQILARAATLPVQEITNELRVEPNQVYVIPRNTGLTIEGGLLKLLPREAGRRPHKPIDAFFESLAQDQHERAVGVVLSGTASDGTLGLEAIKAEGGITFAQDDTAKHESMPRNAIASGVVDLVLSPAGIAEELARIAKHPVLAGPRPEAPGESKVDDDDSDQGESNRERATAHAEDDSPLPSGGPPEAQAEPRPRSDVNRSRTKESDAADQKKASTSGNRAEEEDYKKILLLLRNHSGVDFSLYKSTTIRRRIMRRLVLTKSPTLRLYALSLKDNVKELDALYSDVLISVTSFFRNPETFDAVKTNVIPTLLNQRTDDPVRCWVLGCSTGQEAYSLTMAFAEVAEKAPKMRRLQVFATDLNESLLDKARHGLYAKSLADDISPQRLRRFFTEEQGGYRVSKSLREMVVFARQNLIADPPFSRMDLISCRNLLIYLEPALQQRAIPTFHYALRPGGFLLLGASESIGGFTELFDPVDKKHKIYAKKAAVTPPFHAPLTRSERSLEPHHLRGLRAAPSTTRAGRIEPPDGVRGHLSAQREADRVAISQFAPPGVLINAENQVLQFRGATEDYLQLPAGKASFDLLKMAREGLMLPLRAAIEEAARENRSSRREGVRIHRSGPGDEEGEPRTVNLEVIPLRNVPEPSFLVVFEEPDRVQRAPRHQHSRPVLSKSEEADRIAQLEADLAETRDYLQATEEEHEATNEELQASNEEVQSANEELQSLNEELETSKEELESSNEELTTVNDEMSHRNSELIRLNNDLVNLQTSARLAILLVGRDLSITRFSPQAETQFDLLATDVGRPIGHVRHQLFLAAEGTSLDLESIAREVIKSVREQEWEVRDKAGRWYSLRVRPYMTLDNRIDGAVLVLVDIDELKGVEQVVAAARDYAQNTVSTVREPMLVLDKDLRVESANLAFYRTFGVLPKQTIGSFLYDLGNGQWNIPGLRTLLETTLTERTSIDDFLVEHEFQGIGRKVMLLNARRMHDPERKTLRILLAIEDITKRQRAEADTAHLAAIVASSEDAIISTDVGATITSWNKGAEHLFGYSAEEIVGQPVSVLIPATRSDTGSRSGNAARTPEVIARYEAVRQRKNGTLVDVSVTVSPLKDATGQIIGTSKIARDITERKRTEERLREAESRLKEVVDGGRLSSDFRALFEASPTPFIVITPPDYRIIAVNNAYLHATMTEREEILGRGFFEAFPDNPNDPDATGVRNLRDSLERVRANRKADVMAVQRHDMRLPPDRGGAFEPRYWSPINAPVLGPDGEVAAIIHRVEDVTASVLMDENAPKDQLKRDQQAIIDRLREAVDQLTRNEALIREQTEAIAAESRRKDEFLAMLSHELRNPLAPIRGATHLLKLRERPGNDDPVQRQAREIIERQVGNMTKLINDLLEVSRVVSGRIRLNLQPSDLNQLARHAIETATPLIEQRRHTLTVHLSPTPVWLQADATRIEEIFVNLINNAAKYTDEGGQIEIWCEPVAGADGKGLAQVRVRDNGAGISPQLLPRIFDLFTQSDRTLDRAQGGLGIGLTLAHRLVELHGGSIEATSPPEGASQGSEFFVRLPMMPAPAAPPPPPPSAEEQGRPEGVRVLVVDDNIDQAMMLATGLRHIGYSVECAYTGPDGLKVGQQWRPDIVLLDIGLPGMDGYEVARRLRSDQGTEAAGPGMKLIALTGYGRDSDLALAREAGFDGHLVKPVEFDQLHRMMMTLIMPPVP